MFKRGKNPNVKQQEIGNIWESERNTERVQLTWICKNKDSRGEKDRWTQYASLLEIEDHAETRDGGETEMNEK
jgi:hypothetical protein